MKENAGFTLIELMFTLALAAIVITLGVPGFRNFIESNQATAAANGLLAALNTARSESVTRNLPVAVCASSDGTSCTGKDNWAVGWIVFTDGGPNPGTVDPGETVLRVGSPLSTGTLTTTVSYVRYMPTGLTAGSNNLKFDLTLGKQTRTIALTATGQASAG